MRSRCLFSWWPLTFSAPNTSVTRGHLEIRIRSPSLCLGQLNEGKQYKIASRAFSRAYWCAWQHRHPSASEPNYAHHAVGAATPLSSAAFAPNIASQPDQSLMNPCC